MTQHSSTSGHVAPMTVRGADGRPHLVSDMKSDTAVRPATRIRPIVPNIFRTPD